MIIKEQRGKKCPAGWNLVVGNVSCEECNHFKFRISKRVNQQGVKLADEFCELLLEKGTEV